MKDEKKETIILSKAERLVVSGKVKRDGEYWFKVEGDTDTYNVKISPSDISCECHHAANEGIPNGRLCSHLCAVIMYIIREKPVWPPKGAIPEREIPEVEFDEESMKRITGNKD